MIAICLLMLPFVGAAQVKYSLSYDANTKVYTVSLVSDVTWHAPQCMVGSAQVVLRVASNQDFTPAITSLVDGLVWADNAYIDNPTGGNGYTFICVAIVNGPTSKIGFASGETFPLFSFVNAAGGCPGEVALLRNEDPMVQAIRAGGYNVTQHMAVLAAHGNAFKGTENVTVDCAVVTGTSEASVDLVGDVKIMPVPSDKLVTVQWNLLASRNTQLEAVICDAQGREVWREKTGNDKGPHSMQVAVETWPAGLYRVRFVSGDGHQTRSWNMMVVH